MSRFNRRPSPAYRAFVEDVREYVALPTPRSSIANRSNGCCQQNLSRRARASLLCSS